MITRTINIDLKVEIACCRDGIEIFSPKERTFQKIIVSKRIRFDENLIIWRDRAVSIAEKYLSELAEDECRRGVSAVLCKFIVDSTGTSVDEKIEVPDWIYAQLEYMERLYEEAKTIEEKTAIRDEIDKLKAQYGIV